jgi:hypothetical protein
MRRERLSCGVWLLLCLASFAWAQSQPAPKAKLPGTAASPATSKARVVPKLLDSDDGLAILGAALEARHKAEVRSDCSHLVHAIYEKAGFPYKYMRSSDLYAGVEEFRRVSRPQPGDLIVWPGHAGIVVSPAQHTFYSSLRSGFGVQPYDSVYWKGRGRPRFYRYVRSLVPPPPPPPSRVASLKTTEMRKESAEAKPAKASLSAADEQPDTSTAESIDPPPFIPLVPTVLVVKSTRPTADQVKASVLAQFIETGASLQPQDTLHPEPSLIAFSRIGIQKVHLNRDSGWVDVRISDPLVIAGTTSRAGKLGETQRWILHRRSDTNWELALPQSAVYVPRDAAVRLLAHQLATLTDDSAGHTDQKAQLAHLLGILLDTR